MMPKLASLAIECCKEVWLVFQTFVFFGGNFEKEAQLGVIVEVSREEYGDGPSTFD